ncbi:hypothetical protein BDZ97DRAFT_1776048 [Flammula alnicola]|nr:hypothetical protein BDZ97DRAFT_1776048 [Flammula alnicola]
MSSRTSSPSPDEADTTTFKLSGMKRQIAALQDELTATKAAKSQRKTTTVTVGRGIPKLVSMFDSVEQLIAESDRRLTAEDDEIDGVDTRSQHARDRTYKSYELMITLIPKLDKILIDDDQDKIACFINQLQKGASEARGDDIRRIKEELAVWLNEMYAPTPPFSPKDRAGRGLRNDYTGMLLCPTHMNWDDLKYVVTLTIIYSSIIFDFSIRANIRNGDEGYTITTDIFLNCLYPQLSAAVPGIERDFDQGFLRSLLLVKAYCAIFTSPTSADNFEAEETADGPVRKKQKATRKMKATKNNVATLLRMEGKVTPRSIAYVATLLIFNLTDAEQWPADAIYNGFDFQTFYNVIVDYFDDATDAISRRNNRELLAWWNKQVFPQHASSTANDDLVWKSVVAKRAARARARASGAVGTA